MKKVGVLIASITAGLLLVTSCGSKDSSGVSVLKAMDSQKVESSAQTTTVYQIDTTKSVITWVGSKPGGQHNGIFMLANGYFEVANQLLVGGRFTINMNKLQDKDLSDQASREKLEMHLKSADFFNVDTFPFAEFVITKAIVQKKIDATHSEYRIEGNLTLKRITKNIQFKALVEMLNGEIKATTGYLGINRTDWGVNYGSKSIFGNLKNKFIDDQVVITVFLTTGKQ